MATGVPARLTPAEGRKFGFVVGTAFLGLGALLWWRGWSTGGIGAAVLGGALVLAALVVPGRLGPVQRAWMGFALALSRVTTPIFMGVVFFGVLMPIGVIKRRVRGNPVLRPRASDSYWVNRSVEHGGRSDLERQF